MKRLIVAAAATLAAVAVLGSVAFAAGGNGAPSGAHYNLNIIGVQNEKDVSNDNSQGGRIFVLLKTKNTQVTSLNGQTYTIGTKIGLTPSTDSQFHVTDYNGTDGFASFQLPADVSTSYTVWVRALGTPGGKADMSTCAYETDGTLWCNVDPNVVHLERKAGQSKFENVTDDLLFVYADINDDGQLEKVPLFDSSLQDYFWNYVNNGLKLAQLRFYPAAQ